MNKKHLFIVIILLSSILIGCSRNNNEQEDTDASSSEATAVPGLSAETEATPAIATQPVASVQPTQNVKLSPTANPASTANPAPTATPVPSPTPTPAPVDLANSMTKEEFPVIDGSTATIPLSEAVYELATGATKEEAATDIVHTKTTQCYYRLVNREADLLIVYEPSDEVKEFMKKNRYELQMKPIGRDALVFMANTSNPVESLTKEQLIQIYSGKIMRWSEVGGEDKELLAFQRPVNSGSQTLMLKLVMGNIPMVSGPEVQTFTEMSEILKAMADYTNEGNTLGYSVFYYAKNMYNLPELKFMKVNGVAPSSQTIYDSTYPFINEFYAVIREDEPYNSNAHKIFDWLTQEEGQELVRDTGYVPVSIPPSNVVPQKEPVTDQIPDGYVYIVKSDMTTEEGVSLNPVTIYEGNWELKYSLKNVSFFSEAGLVSKEEILPISMSIHIKDSEYEFRMGLLQAGSGDFILQPLYNSLYAIDADKNYYYAATDEKYMIVDRKGRVQLSGEIDNYYVHEETRGDYYWIYHNNNSKNSYIQIYDEELKLVKKLPMDIDNSTIYKDDGTVVLSKASFLKKFGYPENAADTFFISGYSDQLMIVYYDDYYWVMDSKLNLIKKHKRIGEIYDSYYEVFYDIYREVSYVNQDRVAKFYDKKGFEISDEGTGFENLWKYFKVGNTYMDNAYVYLTEDDGIDILDSMTGEHSKLKLPNAKDYILESVFGDYVVLNTNSSAASATIIFYKEKMIGELPELYCANYYQALEGLLLYATTDDYSVMNYMMLDSEGNVLYQSNDSEEITAIDDKYLQVNRGNYTCVIDYQGNIVFKMIAGQLSND